MDQTKAKHIVFTFSLLRAVETKKQTLVTKSSNPSADLTVLEKGKVALETTSSSSPGVFRPTDSEDYVHVVIPMFVQW